ncbi:hypothetical protein RMCBS344292_03855 [Rhizopus microsporus]|nr:hypothetical protein RMCBS344292_03855 [Rhizopus microsporus]
MFSRISTWKGSCHQIPRLYGKPTHRFFQTTRLRLTEGLQNLAVPNTTVSNIGVTEQTAQLYLDNVFPLRMSVWDIRQLVFRNSKALLESKVHQAIPSPDLPHDFAIKEIIARTKDGGAIVKFTFRSTDATKTEKAKDIVERIQEYIQQSNIVAPFNLQQVRAFLVKGQPFLEDILARYPTPRLRIEFQGDPTNVEALYTHLRPYGRIFDISLYPNPNIGKDPARYAIVQFTRIRYATSARNCLHGHVIDNTRLNILYEKQMRTNVVKDWLVNHPRITVPVIAAVFAGVTYAVFDPIRIFFVTSKVTQRFNPQEYALYRWLRKETWARLIPGDDRQPLPEGSAWADDFEQTEKLKSWLAERPETFILITGHKGSGKSALVKAAIHEKKIANARNQSEMTKNLAKEVGYFPVFTWVSSMSGLIDTVVAATTGQKANLTSSPDSQMKNILETVAIALRDTIPSEKEARLLAEDEKDTTNLLQKLKDFIVGHKITVPKQTEKPPEENEGEKPGEEDNLDQHSIPIVVIDNFMYRETSKSAILWEELAEWAALLIENGIAHVVFVSSNASVMKTLGKALPGKTFSSITLSDAPPEMAMSFIKKQLGEEVTDPNLPEIVSALGGRLTELEVLVQKMKMNMDALSAFEDIVTRNLIEIRKYGFGDSSNEDNKLEWSSIQFWTIVKLLSEKHSINYDELKWDSLFNGNDAPLRAMERTELITVVHKDVFASSMEIETNMYLKKQAEENMAKLEDTIEKLSNISQPNRPPREVDARIRYLLTKLISVQKSIEQYDAAIKSAKEDVSKSWVEDEN